MDRISSFAKVSQIRIRNNKKTRVVPDVCPVSVRRRRRFGRHTKLMSYSGVEVFDLPPLVAVKTFCKPQLINRLLH